MSKTSCLLLCFLLLTFVYPQVQAKPRKQKLTKRQPLEYDITFNIPNNIDQKQKWNQAILTFENISFKDNQISFIKCIPDCTFNGQSFYFNKTQSFVIRIKIRTLFKLLPSHIISNIQLLDEMKNNIYFLKIKGQYQTHQNLNKKQVYQKQWQILKVSQLIDCSYQINLINPNQWYYNSSQNLSVVIYSPNNQNFTFSTSQIYNFNLPLGYTLLSSSQCQITPVLQFLTCQIEFQNQIVSIYFISSSQIEQQYLNFTISNVQSPPQASSNGFSFNQCSNQVLFNVTCQGSNCQTCQSESSPNNCTSCYSENYLIINQQAGVCQSCGNQCQTCLNSTFCTSCTSGNYLFNNSCTENCPEYINNNSSTYANQETGTCDNCSNLCIQCSNNSYCYMCADISLKYNNLCYLSCPPQAYNLVNITNQCYDCPSTCTVCSDSQTCSQCIQSAFLFNNSCFTICPQGYYYTNQNCSICFELCAYCSSNSTYCQTCITGYYIINGICMQCPFLCSQCTQYQCTKCINITNNISNSCEPPCPLGNYSLQQECITCPFGCAICYNSSSCYICNNSYYLQKGNCLPCLHPCINCLSINICLDCIVGVNLLNYTCFGCLSGYSNYSSFAQCTLIPLNQKPILLPFTIASVILFFLILLLFLIKRKTLFFLTMFSLNSLIQTAAIITYICFFIQYKQYERKKYETIIICIFSGIGVMIVNNFIQIFIYKKMSTQYLFSLRLKGFPCFYKGLVFLSLIDFKIFYIQFSRISFTFNVYFENTSHFSLFKILLICSFFPSLLIMAGCIIQIISPFYYKLQYPPFARAIDCLIVTLLQLLYTFVFLIKCKYMMVNSFQQNNNDISKIQQDTGRQTQMRSLDRTLKNRVIAQN